MALMSDSVVSAVYAAIPGSKMDSSRGGWLYPENAVVPDVEVAVGDKMFKIDASDFPLGSASNGMLFGGIQSRGTLSFDILGDGELVFTFACETDVDGGGHLSLLVFLKCVYVVFDHGNTRIGMAQRST